MVYTLDTPSLPQTLFGSFFFMYPYNRCIVRRSWWLSRLPASSYASPTEKVEVDAPKHGEEMVYREAMQMPSKFQAFILSSIVFGLFGLFFTSSLVSFPIGRREAEK